MVGRHHELSVLIGRAEELLGGRGGVVLVEGDPGIGKTRLIDEFVSASEWRGLRVMRAGHSELSRMSPYDSLRELLAEATVGLRGEHLAEVLEPVWLRQAAEVLPQLSDFLPPTPTHRPSLKPEEESRRTGEALVRTLLAQGDLGPAVVVIEDVHWCDDDSMEVLVSAGTRLAASGVLLCLTYRRFEAEQTEAVWSGITALEALPSGSRLVLGPLTAAEVHELATSRLSPGELPALDNRRLVELTDGNPLYVVEALRDPSILFEDDLAVGAGEIGLLSLPDAVASSIRSRLQSLAPQSRRVLEVLAVLAEPASVGLIASAAEMERLPVVEALARMADQGLIEEVDGSCRFGHEQTRQVVYGLMTPGVRAAHHSRIFEVLAERDNDRPDRLGHHARLADRMHDARTWFLDAGRRALALNGYRTAAEHFGQADQAAQEAGIELSERAEDLLTYEHVLDVLGRRDEQAMFLKSLREIELDPEVEQELVRREVLLLVKTEDLAKAVRVGQEALAEAEASGRPTHGLLTALAAAKRHSGDLDAVVELARRALDASSEPRAAIEAETILGKALLDQADYLEGCRHLQQAVSSADELGDTRAKVEALGYLATAQSNAGSTDEAIANFESALQLSRDIGFRWGEGVNLLNLATTFTWRGRGGAALGLYDEARSALGSVRDARGEAFIDLNQAMLWLWVLGDTETALERANSAAIYFRSVGDDFNECRSLCVVATADLERGKRRMAARRVRDLLPRTRRPGYAVAEVQVRRVQVTLHEAAGETLAALEELERLLGICDQFGLGAQVPILASRAASHALAIGAERRADALLRRALENRMDGAEMAHLASWYCATVLDELNRDDEATKNFKAAFELLALNLEGLPDDLVHRGRTKVEVHRQLVADYERRFEVQRSVVLPTVESPTGRALRPDELIAVTLTVNHPDDWLAVTEHDRRHARIRRLVGEASAAGAGIRIIDLASALGVSDRTIKRDLADLRANGEEVITRRGS
jgi:predicted ATPase